MALIHLLWQGQQTQPLHMGVCYATTGKRHTISAVCCSDWRLLWSHLLPEVTNQIYVHQCLNVNFIVQDFNLLWSPIFNTHDLPFHVRFQQITFKDAVLFLSLVPCWIFGTKYLFYVENGLWYPWVLLVPNNHNHKDYELTHDGEFYN
jgi:hypothetical protein